MKAKPKQHARQATALDGQALTTALAEIERLELALQEARRLREAQEEALRIAQQHETTLDLLARAWRKLTGGS